MIHNYLKKSNSAVWKHFLREEKGPAMCKYTDCKKIFKIGGGSAKGLHTHLLSVHKINLTPATISANTPDEPLTKKTKTLANYFPILEREEKSLPATLARLTALDGISFNFICRSSDVCAVLSATGFKILFTTRAFERGTGSKLTLAPSLKGRRTTRRNFFFNDK